MKLFVKVMVVVKWNGEYIEIFMEEIVCGDFVWFLVGDMILVDMCLLFVKDLFIF